MDEELDHHVEDIIQAMRDMEKRLMECLDEIERLLRAVRGSEPLGEASR